MGTLEQLCYYYGLEPNIVTIINTNTNNTYENCLIWNEFNKLKDTTIYNSFIFYNNIIYDITVEDTNINEYLFNKNNILYVKTMKERTE